MLNETITITIVSPTITGAWDTIITPSDSIALPVPSTKPSAIVVTDGGIDGAILKDDSTATYTSYTIPANNDTLNDVVLMPAAPAPNDAFYFGKANINYDVLRYVINIGTAGAGTWTQTYYYYNGAAWVVVPTANIVFKSDPFLNFRTAGFGSLWITPPTDWAAIAVNGVTLYWLEARITAWTARTVIPLGTRVWGGGGSAGLHRLVNYVRTKTLIGR
jgi:hypothetical protein